MKTPTQAGGGDKETAGVRADEPEVDVKEQIQDIHHERKHAADTGPVNSELFAHFSIIPAHTLLLSSIPIIYLSAVQHGGADGTATARARVRIFSKAKGLEGK